LKETFSTLELGFATRKSMWMEKSDVKIFSQQRWVSLDDDFHPMGSQSVKSHPNKHIQGVHDIHRK